MGFLFADDSLKKGANAGMPRENLTSLKRFLESRLPEAERIRREAVLAKLPEECRTLPVGVQLRLADFLESIKGTKYLQPNAPTRFGWVVSSGSTAEQASEKAKRFVELNDTLTSITQYGYIIGLGAAELYRVFVPAPSESAWVTALIPLWVPQVYFLWQVRRRDRRAAKERKNPALPALEGFQLPDAFTKAVSDNNRRAACSAACSAASAAANDAYVSHGSNCNGAGFEALAEDAAIMASSIVVSDLEFDGKEGQTALAEARWDAWQRGYGVAGSMGDVLSVYRVGEHWAMQYAAPILSFAKSVKDAVRR